MGFLGGGSSCAWNALQSQNSLKNAEETTQQQQGRLLGGWSQVCKNIDRALALVAQEANTSGLMLACLSQVHCTW